MVAKMGDLPSNSTKQWKISTPKHKTLDQVSGLTTSTSTLRDTSFDSTLLPPLRLGHLKMC